MGGDRRTYRLVDRWHLERCRLREAGHDRIEAVPKRVCESHTRASRDHSRVSSFRVGITPDACDRSGRLLFDFGPLNASPIGHVVLDVKEGELAPEAVSDLDAVVIASSRFLVSCKTVHRSDRLALIARLGAGYETIDVEACTEAGVAITTSPDAVRRPMATAAIAFLLALALKLPTKDRYTREGRWSEGAEDLGISLTAHNL